MELQRRLSSTHIFFVGRPKVKTVLLLKIKQVRL